MTRQTFDELTFALPETHTYLGVIRLRGEQNDNFAANLVLTKDRLRDGETVQTYVDRQMVDLGRKLKKFGLRGRRQVVVDGVDAWELACVWQGTQGQVEQRVTILYRPPHVFTFTASASKSQAEAAFAAFGVVLASVRFAGLAPSGHELK